MDKQDPNFLYYLPNVDSAGNQVSQGSQSHSTDGGSLTADDIQGIVSEGIRTLNDRIILATGQIQSQNFVTGVAGWQIDSLGNCEFQNGTFRGTITATSGTIGGFSIGATTISSTGLTLTSGTSASLAFGTTPPTSPTSGTGIYIDKTGLFGLSSNTQNFKIDATNGNITAKAGTIGGFTISSTDISATGLNISSTTPSITLGTGGNAITLNGSTGKITSSGSTWSLAGDGTLVGFGKFGGTGSDGALSITSGTTTINLGGAAVVTKNYTSISITGTGVLAFSNPGTNGTIIVLKSQGNVTLTSSATPMIDASGMGAAGAAGVLSSNGTDGTVAEYIFSSNSSNGKLGATAGTVGAGGIGYTTLPIYTISSNTLFRKMNYITPGSGGGSGGAAVAGLTGGNGGNGGGGLIIECGGALNFTTTNGISVAGKNGTAGSNNGGSGAAASGGGGGAGGMCIILYNSLTSATGTVTVSGGNGGNGGLGGGSGTGAGGAGGAGMYNGAGGTGGANGVAGNNGSNSLTTGSDAGTGGARGSVSASSGGGGGGGTAGEYFITLNTEF